MSAQGHVVASDLRLGYTSEIVLSLESFVVEPGEFVSVLGPSGCGKTTLLGALAGFVPPMSGRVEIDGADVTYAPAHKRPTGMVFQSYALFPHMTVEQNLHYGLKARKFSKAQRDPMVQEALELVRLSDFAKRYPTQLSGGQQQRVAIARALVTRPAVLLLDEPLSNLDAKLRRQMRDELRELQQEIGTTMIFVTHDQDEALAMSDRIVLLSKGELEQEGSPEDLYQRPVTSFAADFIGGANLFTKEINDNDTVSVLGQSLPVERALVSGTSATFALRPELVRVSLAEEGRAGLQAVILTAIFSSGRYEYRLLTSTGEELRASSAGNAWALPAGTAVVLDWQNSDVSQVRENR